MNESTNITYEKVRTDANIIKDCSNTMDNIFNDFDASMKRVGAEDVYVGDASESLSNRFNTLKRKFDTYVKLVNLFSSIVTSASEQTSATEKALQQEAENLNS